MSAIQITNCHVHLFTNTHVPKNYPSAWLKPLRNRPWLVGAIGSGLDLVGQDKRAEMVRRLRRFQEEGRLPEQAAILENIDRHYPKGTRHVVLPMDLSQIGFGDPAAPIEAQHRELAALRDTHPDKIIPFAMIDPRSDPDAVKLWEAIDTLGFKGIKLYPRLGYAPDDTRLMNHVYPRANDHEGGKGLPVMTHCSRGGVQGRDVGDADADAYTDPASYADVLTRFPNLRLCLAHFGGARDWKAYVNPELSDDPKDEYNNNWQEKIREMIGSGAYPNLWTDISYTLFDFEENIPFLRIFLEGDDRESISLRHRVLFGSDYYMTRQEALSERAVCIRLRNALGEELFRQIAEDNPKVWLGEAEDPLPAALAGLSGHSG